MGITLILQANIYIVAVVLMSIVAFVLFGLDKRKAIKNSDSRVPERTLWMMALLGGWPGMLVGQQLFRHKTIKLSFKLVLWSIIALHIVLIGLWLYWFCQEQEMIN